MQKNLYLLGTNKNVGYMLGNTMHIYDRFIKYFPFSSDKFWTNGFGVRVEHFMVEVDDKIIELKNHKGWYHEIEERMYTFFDCEFKTPDNLDVIEITYLNKNLIARKKHGKR